MLSKHFSLKVGDGVLHLQDANFKVSSPFSMSEINELITQKLQEINYRTDLRNVNYVIRGNHLFAEGIAYEDVQPPNFHYMTSD